MSDTQNIRRLSELLTKVDVFVNGGADEVVSTNNGPLKTIAGVVEDLKNTRGVQYIKDFSSVQHALQDTNTLVGDVIRVVNNGYYQKNNVGGFDKISYIDLYDIASESSVVASANAVIATTKAEEASRSAGIVETLAAGAGTSASTATIQASLVSVDKDIVAGYVVSVTQSANVATSGANVATMQATNSAISAAASETRSAAAANSATAAAISLVAANSQADISIAEAADATAQAITATAQASIATTQAASASTQAVVSTTQAEAATASSASASASASVATTQASISSAAAVASVANVPIAIHAAINKITPVDADEIGFLDSVAAWALKKFTFANLKSVLQASNFAKYATDASGNVTGLVGPGGESFSFGASRLSRWQKKLATDAPNAKIAILGDSTSDAAGSAVGIYNTLMYKHARAGDALQGMVADAAHFMPFGYNGSTLAYWLSTNTAAQAALWAAAPDLIIFSFGINDVRLGQTTQAQLQALMVTAITLIKTNLPNCDILLRMPNSFLTTNVTSYNYVQTSGGTINPAGLAQTYSTLLRDTYLSFVNKYSFVDVIDMQAELFGTVSQAGPTALMADQLHPSPVNSTNNGVPTSGGYVSVADKLAKAIGRLNSAFSLGDASYLCVRSDIQVVAAGNGYIDLAGSERYSIPISQFPITTADFLYVEGLSGPIALTSAGIYRPFGGGNIRITLGGTDFTGAAGKRATLALTHVGPTTNDRQIVAVDLPSIATLTTTNVSVTVIGARTGDLQDATNIVCTPPATFHAAGLRLFGCYPSANNTVQLLVNNPTAGVVDLVSADFAFWVVR